MKLTYLGTAAAEGFPAIFCNCEYCKEARVLGGKNIRTRSQTIIGDDLLIDLPADTYHHFLTNNIEGDRIKYILITHAHQDHLYLSDLRMRGGAYSHNMREGEITVVAGGTAYEMLAENKYSTVRVVKISPFETFTLGDYKVTAIPARHAPGGGALNYIIEGEKTLLYAHDTGYFYEETFDFLKEKGFVFDLVSLDCTNVDIPIADTGNHMGIENDFRVLERLRSIGAINDSTVKVINHFSHNGNPLYERLAKRVEEYGILVSYDGRTLEF